VKLVFSHKKFPSSAVIFDRADRPQPSAILSSMYPNLYPNFCTYEIEGRDYNSLVGILLQSFRISVQKCIGISSLLEQEQLLHFLAGMDSPFPYLPLL